jgi:DNA-binding transcriptional LysR family regulator
MSETLAADSPVIDEALLRLLRIFRAVAECGGLTAAESRLSMERSTISRHLRSLETKLGATLCYRGPTGFDLTEFGRTVLRVAVAAGDTLDMVRDELNGARNAISGDLHLGVADSCLTNPNCHVHRAIAAFREQAPAATLHLSIRTPDELLQGLLERRLHIGITGAILGNADIRQHTLFPEQFRLYVGLREGAEPPSIVTLLEQGYVLVTRQNDYRTLNLAKRLKLQRHAVALGLEAVATLLVGGGFVGYLPTHYVDALRHLYRLVEVRDARAFAYRTKFAMATVQSHRLPAAGQLLAAALIQAHAAPLFR